MIKLKTRDDIQRIKNSGLILIETVKKIKDLIVPGISTKEIDRFAHDYIVEMGGIPSFLGYLDFPASVCISINNEVIHGIPGKRKLTDGDIVGIDLGVNLNGYFSDAAHTFQVGGASPERQKLLKVTKECLELAVGQVKLGNRVSDISGAVASHASRYNYGVVRQYCGHGVGFAQHEDPQVPNYVSSGPNPRLKNGMVLAIEPMINTGTWEISILEDDWTVVTKDGGDSAHFEYTVALIDGKAENLTPIDV